MADNDVNNVTTVANGVLSSSSSVSTDSNANPPKLNGNIGIISSCSANERLLTLKRKRGDLNERITTMSESLNELIISRRSVDLEMEKLYNEAQEQRYQNFVLLQKELEKKNTELIESQKSLERVEVEKKRVISDLQKLLNQINN